MIRQTLAPVEPRLGYPPPITGCVDSAVELGLVSSGGADQVDNSNRMSWEAPKPKIPGPLFYPPRIPGYLEQLLLCSNRQDHRGRLTRSRAKISLKIQGNSSQIYIGNSYYIDPADQILRDFLTNWIFSGQNL